MSRQLSQLPYILVFAVMQYTNTLNIMHINLVQKTIELDY